jgi:hypothetical protein
MDEVDEWFDACGEVMETVCELTDACEIANEGVLILCEAAELADKNIKEKTLEGILKFFIKGTFFILL